MIRRRTNARVRSSNLRDIHLHKKENKYGRQIYQLETYTSSLEGEQIWERDLATWEIYIFIRRRTNIGERSCNLRDINLHKKVNKYGIGI